MGYYQERSRNRLSIGHSGNTLTTLIAVNLVVFVLLMFIQVIYFFTYSNSAQAESLFHEQIVSWVTLPAHLPTLITRPWTIITHFIAHIDVWHIIANMIWLWVFGYIFQDLAGNRKLVPVFVYGALTGAFFYLLAFNLLPAFQNKLAGATALGASAGVMAIALATTTLAPNFRIFQMLNGGIPIWIITMIFVIIDLATIPKSNAGGHIAHLAGAAFGYVFIVLMRRGTDLSVGMNRFFDWVNNLFDPDKPKKAKVIKSQLFYKSNRPPFKKTSGVTQQRIDEILDKINQKGYETLTQEEKDILKRASKEDL